MSSLIKKFLKSIFPILLLKRFHTYFNHFRILTIDRILFPEYSLKPEDFLLYRNGYPFRENNVKIDSINNAEVRAYMKNWYDWTQEEFILKFKGTCIIEPDYGWAVVPSNRLLYYSLGISRTPFLQKPALLTLIFRKKVERVPAAVSLRDTGEENYFHFYNDVLSKIFFLEEHGIEIKDLPVIISKKLWNKPYFRFYYEKSDKLKGLKWLIQDTQYIQSDITYFCKPLTHKTSLLKLIFEPLYQLSGPESKIFITRNKTRSRYLLNSQDIELLFKKYSFRIIDADALSLAEQFESFSGASFIAGIHGAGLTNMMVREGNCKVLEIFPYPEDGYLPFHYIMLADIKNFAYNAINGEKNKQPFQPGFTVDVTKLEEIIKCML